MTVQSHSECGLHNYYSPCMTKVLEGKAMNDPLTVAKAHLLDVLSQYDVDTPKVQAGILAALIAIAEELQQLYEERSILEKKCVEFLSSAPERKR